MLRCWIVSGLVQGVGFRASARAEARRLGVLAGHARDLADGSVEVVAEGSAAQIDSLDRWLAHGPRGARVDLLRQGLCPEARAASPFAIL